MQLVHYENPLATQVILTKDEITSLRDSIELEREHENEFALGFYGLPYEYEHSVEEELNTLLYHLKGIHHGDCVFQARECMKCTAERHLGTTTLMYGAKGKINRSALCFVRKAMEATKNNLLETIEYLEEMSKDWDGIKQAIMICHDHLRLLKRKGQI